MRRSFLLACTLAALGVGVLSFPSNARADDAAVAEAQARFDEGLTLADAGKNEEARLKFQQAVAVLKAPAVLYNLARVEQLTGHELEALEHYRLFLRGAANDPKVTDAMREKTKGYIAELSTKVAQIDVDAPPEARITIDGKPLDERRTEPVAVAPGRHVVEGAFQGRVKSVSVDASAGDVARATLAFESAPATAPPGEVGTTWPTAKIVTVGALAAGAVAGGVLFFVFRGQAQGNVDDARALLGGASCLGVTSDACSQAASLKDERDASQTLSGVALAGGVALAAGAVGAALLWPSAKERTARAVPLVGPGVAGVGLGGRF